MAVSAPSAVAPPTTQYQYGNQYEGASAQYSSQPQYQYPMNGQYQAAQYPSAAYGQQYPGMSQAYTQEAAAAPKEGWDQFLDQAGEVWEKTKVAADVGWKFSVEAYKVAKDVTEKAIEIDREHNVSGKVGHAAYVAGSYAYEGAKIVGAHAQRLDNQYNWSGKAAAEVRRLGGKSLEELEKSTGPLTCCSQQQIAEQLATEEDLSVEARGVSGNGY